MPVMSYVLTILIPASALRSNMKTVKVQKLDRRFAGHGLFKYYVSPLGTASWEARCDKLQEWREWAWQTFGPGTDLEHATRTLNPRDWKWSWDPDHFYCRLYLKGDEELAWFTLKYGV